MSKKICLVFTFLTNTAEASTFEDLSFDIHYTISKHLPLTDMFSASLASKKMNDYYWNQLTLCHHKVELTMTEFDELKTKENSPLRFCRLGLPFSVRPDDMDLLGGLRIYHLEFIPSSFTSKKSLETIKNNLGDLEIVFFSFFDKLRSKWMKILGHVDEIHLIACHVEDRHLKRLECVKKLSLCRSQGFSKKGLKHLKGAESIDLSGCDVTDVHLRPLKDIKRLRMASCRRVSDEGISYLTGVEDLDISKNFSLKGTHFKCLRQVKSLDISQCRLDGGVLSEIKNLESLTAYHSRLKPHDLKDLQALKHLKIDGCPELNAKALGELKDRGVKSQHRRRHNRASIFASSL